MFGWRSRGWVPVVVGAVHGEGRALRGLWRPVEVQGTGHTIEWRVRCPSRLRFAVDLSRLTDPRGGMECQDRVEGKKFWEKGRSPLEELGRLGVREVFHDGQWLHLYWTARSQEAFLLKDPAGDWVSALQRALPFTGQGSAHRAEDASARCFWRSKAMVVGGSILSAPVLVLALLFWERFRPVDWVEALPASAAAVGVGALLFSAWALTVRRRALLSLRHFTLLTSYLPAFLGFPFVGMLALNGTHLSSPEEERSGRLIQVSSMDGKFGQHFYARIEHWDDPARSLTVPITLQDYDRGLDGGRRTVRLKVRRGRLSIPLLVGAEVEEASLEYYLSAVVSPAHCYSGDEPPEYPAVELGAKEGRYLRGLLKVTRKAVLYRNERLKALLDGTPGPGLEVWDGVQGQLQEMVPPPAFASAHALVREAARGLGEFYRQTDGVPTRTPASEFLPLMGAITGKLREAHGKMVGAAGDTSGQMSEVLRGHLCGMDLL